MSENSEIKINNKYIKAEIKGKTEDAFKIAIAIAKACEDIKQKEENEKDNESN